MSGDIFKKRHQLFEGSPAVYNIHNIIFNQFKVIETKMFEKGMEVGTTK